MATPVSREVRYLLYGYLFYSEYSGSDVVLLEGAPAATSATGGRLATFVRLMPAKQEQDVEKAKDGYGGFEQE